MEQKFKTYDRVKFQLDKITSMTGTIVGCLGYHGTSNDKVYIILCDNEFDVYYSLEPQKAKLACEASITPIKE